MDLSRSVLSRRTSSGGTATIVGVEHLSPHAADLVTQHIRGGRPQTVVVEVDRARLPSLGLSHLLLPSPPRPTPGAPPPHPIVLEPFPQQGGFPGVGPLLHVAALSTILSGISDLYGGKQYGGELVAAVRSATEVGAAVVLGDRDIFLTLQRAGAEPSSPFSLSAFPSLVPTALGGVQTAPQYAVPPLLLLRVAWRAALKDWAGLADALADVCEDSAASNPSFASSQAGRTVALWNTLVLGVVRDGAISAAGKTALGGALVRILAALDESPELVANMPRAISRERDVLLAHAIKTAPGERVVAVVGKGHLKGIARAWDEADDVAHVVSPLLAPPPNAALHAYGGPVGSAAALAGTAALLWRRRARGALALLTGTTLVTTGAGLLLVQRATEVRERLRRALLEAGP
jgi:pheromone shutdown protein TraB